MLFLAGNVENPHVEGVRTAFLFLMPWLILSPWYGVVIYVFWPIWTDMLMASSLPILVCALTNAAMSDHIYRKDVESQDRLSLGPANSNHPPPGRLADPLD